MRRQRLNVDPDIGDLEQMLANVQTQLEHEIDLEREKMPSLTSVMESPKMIKRTSSFSKCDTLEYRRPAPRPPLQRINSENSGSHSLNGEFGFHQNGGRIRHADGELGSQSSFQSFRSEPGRHSVLSLPDKRASSNSLNGRHSRTATLPRGYGSTKDKNWEDYWAQ
ncbi:hypothetical protein O0L34_g18901 [Tuta absoluta]|nr:hypothetical protein O0L34_g18901 [Tuta absoluta]